MSNCISSQNIPNFKAVVCIEGVFKAKISELKRSIMDEEKKLYATALKFISIKEALEKFYLNYYLEKLGIYLSILDNLKKKLFGFKNENVFKQEVSCSENFEYDEKELKQLYRQLAKIYHPDRYDSLTEEEREFLEIRMAEVNRYFERKDIVSLKNMLEQAKAELSDEISSLDRIKILNIRLMAARELRHIYEDKIKLLKKDEIYKLIEMSEEERTIEIQKKKELLLSEIKAYIAIIERTKRYSQKC